MEIKTVDGLCCKSSIVHNDVLCCQYPPLFLNLPCFDSRLNKWDAFEGKVSLFYILTCSSYLRTEALKTFV